MLGLIAEELIEFIMTNHTYIVGEEIYLQSTGGPIGLDFSRIVARLMMIIFDKQLAMDNDNHDADIILRLHKRYVDHENLAFDVYKTDKTRHVIEEETANLLKDIANNIFTGMFGVTTDVPA